MSIGQYNHRMVTLARESRELTQSELATQLGLVQGTLSKIEAGDIFITDELVRELSRILKYPTSFFSQIDTVYPFGSSTFYHRRLQNVPSPILRKIEARINIYRFHVARLIRATDLDRRCFFHRWDPSEYGGRIEEMASLLRESWRLPSGSIWNLTRVLEDAGAIVIRFEFGTAKMFGLSEWIPPAPPLFFLNDHPEISADRDRFTLAHEVGHIIMHGIPNPGMEDEADRFASELLMPAKDIRGHFSKPVKLHTVARLKPHWKVSMAALIRRAFDLDIITENQYGYLNVQLRSKGYGKREPPELDVARERPTLLEDLIRAHVKELKYSYAELARLLSIDSEELKNYYRIADEYGGLRVVTA